MVISVVFEFPNGSVEQYHQVYEKGGPQIVEQPGRLHHQCFESGGGFTVVDVWESEDTFAKFGEILGPTLQDLGLATVPSVHRTRRIVTQRGELTDY
jgi:hypothetical protein